MTIKKAYTELVAFLEANENKKVSSIISDIYEMCESKTQSNASMKDKDGNIIAIFCYYHKQWELVSEVEYGKKANSSTGFNTMCKLGTSLWTKQQRTFKNDSAKLLTDVANGTIEPSDIVNLQADLEGVRKSIDTTDMPKGFASEAEVLAHLAN